MIRSYYSEIKSVIGEAVERNNVLLSEAEELLRRAEDKKKYTPEYINELKKQAQEKRYEAERLVFGVNGRVNDIVSRMRNRAEELDTLKGEEITEDAKLLTSGLNLTEKDLLAIANRSNNNTMRKLVQKYALDNDIRFTNGQQLPPTKGRRYADVAKEVESTMYYLNRHYGQRTLQKMYDTCIGEGSILDGMFADD